MHVDQRALALLAVLVVTLAPFSMGASAEDSGREDPFVEDTGAFGAATHPVAFTTGHIHDIVAPTNGAPAFVAWADTLLVELQRVPVGTPLDPLVLRPSFGDGADVVLSGVAIGDEAPSRLWEGPWAREVIPLTVGIPEGTPPGLYDVVLPGLDVEERAVRVYERFPDTLRLVLVADTQTGDPRAMQDGFEDSTGIDLEKPWESEPGPEHVPPDPGPFNEAMRETLGIDLLALEIEPGERWAAYRAAITQINALEPDLVLFSGDLNFGQMVPSSFHAEYQEAWALINGGPGVDGTVYEGFRVPTLVSPGNHDGYVQNGVDGMALWMSFFGPPAYRTTLGDTTFVSLNTYDWSEMDRIGVSLAVSAWGGQVQDPQLAWLRQALCEANGGTPTLDLEAHAGIGCDGAGDERVVTFAHHSPSWMQDTWHDDHGGAYETCPCEGTPGLEQLARGALTFTGDGQAWSGRNRLELRDTLRAFDVDLHAAGHTHRDRIARDIGDGTIVEVPQRAREGHDIRALVMVTEDNEAIAIDQGLAVELLRTGEGPLYVETTTTASDTDQYWGYRPVTWHPGAFPAGALGIAPFEMGYPMTQALIDEIARDPDRWNVDHAGFGLFSTPTAGPSTG